MRRAAVLFVPSAILAGARWRGWRRPSPHLLPLLVGLSSLCFGCHDDLQCFDDQGECSGKSSDCYATCGEDSCRLSCHDVGGRCGAACGAGCDYQCYRTGSGCTAYCEQDCVVDCHDSPLCAGICGPNCRFSCNDAVDCEVRVGSGSSVECSNLTYCLVECLGPCTLDFEGVGSATLLCADGLRQDGAASGTLTCGDVAPI